MSKLSASMMRQFRKVAESTMFSRTSTTTWSGKATSPWRHFRQVLLAGISLVFFAIFQSHALAGMIQPPQGAVLTTSSVTVRWDAELGATAYYLGVATSPQALAPPVLGDIFQAAARQTTVNVFGIPLNGENVYMRLWVKSRRGWKFKDYSYSTQVGVQDRPAEILNPLPPLLLSSGIQIEWDAGHGVSDYFLAAGTSQTVVSQSPWGDLYLYHGTNTSTVISHIPTDGSPIHVRLWSKILSKWFYKDYVYQSVIPAKILQPLPDETINTSSREFIWNAGSGATEYVLMLANSPDRFNESQTPDIYVYHGTAMSTTTPQVIPLAGKVIYARLLSKINEQWFFSDYQYSTALVVPAQMIAPEPGVTIAQYAKRFEWNQASGATEYILAVASSPLLLGDVAQADIFAAAVTDTSVVATGIPLNGQDIYVRLWSHINGEWFFKDYSYQTIFSTDPPNPEAECLERDWRKISFNVGGQTRDLLWRGPEGAWNKGAIIVMHGGGGSNALWCTDSLETHYAMQFAESAIKQGFAVFALDSMNGGFADAWGQSCGKRFDALSTPEANIDLPYIGHVLDNTIPALRPAASNAKVFLVGISNGGFMTIRAATHFDGRISAFAPVAAADPYGTYLSCQEVDPGQPQPLRPGVFLDNETNQPIGAIDACVTAQYLRESTWETEHPINKPLFMQFHHRDDAGVNIACMEKAQKLLVDHGYGDRGTFLLGDGTNLNLEAHFWQREYSQPILDFFTSIASE